MKEEQVILVDREDRELGVMEKLQAHREARLHRAISIFVFNETDQLLMQQRAAGKYHSPLLWTNTCCSHPRPGESTDTAASRRLQEEMGFGCELRPAFSFIYQADMGNGLTEHEFDHVFFGEYSREPLINPDEVASWEYLSLYEIAQDLRVNPGRYTAWFRIIFNKVMELRS